MLLCSVLSRIAFIHSHSITIRLICTCNISHRKGEKLVCLHNTHTHIYLSSIFSLLNTEIIHVFSFRTFCFEFIPKRKVIEIVTREKKSVSEREWDEMRWDTSFYSMLTQYALMCATREWHNERNRCKCNARCACFECYKFYRQHNYISFFTSHSHSLSSPGSLRAAKAGASSILFKRFWNEIPNSHIPIYTSIQSLLASNSSSPSSIHNSRAFQPNNNPSSQHVIRLDFHFFFFFTIIFSVELLPTSHTQYKLTSQMLEHKIHFNIETNFFFFGGWLQHQFPFRITMIRHGLLVDNYLYISFSFFFFFLEKATPSIFDSTEKTNKANKKRIQNLIEEFRIE